MFPTDIKNLVLPDMIFVESDIADDVSCLNLNILVAHRGQKGGDVGHVLTPKSRNACVRTHRGREYLFRASDRVPPATLILACLVGRRTELLHMPLSLLVSHSVTPGYYICGTCPSEQSILPSHTELNPEKGPLVLVPRCV